MDYPTIVNNIPKDSNKYNNTMDCFADIDNTLADSQIAIGSSSNLAQIAQSYACNFADQKFIDYVCILSVLAQVAIDNAKRRFDIDLVQEIKRMKLDMNIKQNKYPAFWGLVQDNFNRNNINRSLKCPMNYLYGLRFNEYKPKESTLPMSYFFVNYELNPNYITCKRVEDLISTYSFDIYSDESKDDYFIARHDFDSIISYIQSMNISGKYVGLFSWLINRCFVITSGMKNTSQLMKSKTQKNKSILLKVLYDVNPVNLLACFSGKNAQI